MSTHTPGPWTVKGPNRFDGFDIFDPKGHAVAEEIRNEANASLIAAAPEMLAALKACLEHYWDDYEFDCLAMARAAIAKTEGTDTI